MIFFVLDDFFRFSKKSGFGYSWPTWKPRFPMDKKPLVEGRIANFGIYLDVLTFCVFGAFFRFSKKMGFLVFLVRPEITLPDGLETYGQRAYR